MIRVNNLIKSFRSIQRGHTFKDTVRSIFAPTWVDVEAVKGVSFEVEAGELIGYLGPNGAGKSTTLKILTGVLFPTSGEVDVMGYTPWKHRKQYVACIGAVFGQKSQLIWDIPPIDSFYMNKAIYSIPSGDFQARLKEMTTMLDVEEVIQKPTRNLSLGERMKCEFIMAMLHNPPIVFLDEPTIGLDVIAKEKIREFIKEQNAQGKTFILTTHDLDDVEHLAKRVIVINHGQIVFNDDMNALKSHLGQKKIIHLATHRPLSADLQGNGLTILQAHSPYDAEIELDVAQLPLNQFIQRINGSNIRDLSIQELPIERVIKELYVMP